MTVGERIPHLLAMRGIDIIFGIPGVHNVELYRGIPDSGLRHVVARHEQALGFMADGYARACGQPGVCFVISGPGVTNIATAMGQALADSIPMLVIAAVPPQLRRGRGVLHDMPDQRALAASVSRHSANPQNIEEFETELDAALALFASQRPGPVYLELTTTLLLEKVLENPTKPAALPSPVHPEHAQTTRIIDYLNTAQAPVILAGGGAKRADVQSLAERLDAPVVMTVNGRGLLTPEHPLAVSLTPSLDSVRQLISEADVVLALGTELGSTDYDFYEDGDFPTPRLLIRIDLDPDAPGVIETVDVPVRAHVEHALPAVMSGLSAGTRDCSGNERARKARAGERAMPTACLGDLALLNTVRDCLPSKTIVGDSTQLVYSACFGFAPTNTSGFFCSATGFGTLGYGLPAAIGAALAKDDTVVALVGDGGLQFTLAELSTAVEAKARVILLLHDNSGYGEIRHYMVERDIKPEAVDLHTPDLCAIAAACGWAVNTVDPDNLDGQLQQASESSMPTMLYLAEDTRRLIHEHHNTSSSPDRA